MRAAVFEWLNAMQGSRSIYLTPYATYRGMLKVKVQGYHAGSSTELQRAHAMLGQFI